MEALIVALLTLIVIVLLEAGYCIALCLLRWAPSLMFGLLICWLAHRHGVDSIEAMALGGIAVVVCKQVLRPRFFYD